MQNGGMVGHERLLPSIAPSQSIPIKSDRYFIINYFNFSPSRSDLARKPVERLQSQPFVLL